MSLKDLLQEWKNCDDKYERSRFIENNMDEIVIAYMESGKNEQNVRKITNLLRDKKFIKTLNKLVVDERSEYIDSNIVIPLSEIVLNSKVGDEEDCTMSPKTKQLIVEIIERKLSKKMKKLGKKAKISEAMSLQLLLQCPERLDDIKGAKSFFFINRLLKKMYGLHTMTQSKEESDNLVDIETLDTIITFVVGEESKLKFVNNILLEKFDKTKYLCDAQLDMWNALSEWALCTLEEIGKKSQIASEIDENYIKRRKLEKKQQRDGQRRLDLTEVDSESFPKVSKAIKHLINEYGNSVAQLLK